MREAKEVAGGIGLAAAIIGGLMLFYSIFILVIFPEAERSAFPLPLGLPGLVLMSAGLAAYFASKVLVSGADDVSDSSRDGP